MTSELINVEDKNYAISKIKKSYNEIYINIDDEIEEQKKNRDIFITIDQAEQDDIIYVILNTIGGRLSTMNQIVNHLLDTKAKTKAIIHEASSAGTGIALACDEIEVKKFGYVMFHNASGGACGKIHEIESRVDFIKGWTKEIFTSLYRGFLTDVELKQMFDGKDFYFNKDEIERRLVNWVPIRKRG